MCYDNAASPWLRGESCALQRPRMHPKAAGGTLAVDCSGLRPMLASASTKSFCRPQKHPLPKYTGVISASAAMGVKATAGTATSVYIMMTADKAHTVACSGQAVSS